MKANGTVFKYGDNVDTDVIIPARYLNSSDPAELAQHCMEDIDKEFVKKVQKGDIIVANKNFGCGSSREHAPIAIKASGVSCVSACLSLSVRKRHRTSKREMRWKWISTAGSSPTRQKEPASKARHSLSSCRKSLRLKA